MIMYNCNPNSGSRHKTRRCDGISGVEANLRSEAREKLMSDEPCCFAINLVATHPVPFSRTNANHPVLNNIEN